MCKIKKYVSLLLTMSVFAASCLNSMATEPDSVNEISEAVDEEVNNEVELPTRDSIRVGTFNIAGGTRPDVSKMTEVLTENDIDFAGLQEVDVNTSRNPYDMLAAFCGTTYLDSSYQKAMDYAGGYYGIGIISKQEILETDGGNLTTEASQETRAWQKILVEVDGEQIAIYNTHLSVQNSKDTTKNQIQEIISIMDEDPTEYKIVTGDFNINLDKEFIYPFLENYNISNGKDGIWYDSYTGTSNLANRGLDNIITTRNIQVNDIQMVDTTSLSDHNLFYIDFELLDEEVVSDEYLDIMISKAEAVDTSMYTAESYQAVEEALEAAKALSEDASQEEINTAVENLINAIDSLVLANVALGKPVTSPKGKAERITDGNLSNYWDGGAYPTYFVIDLEDVYQISKFIAYPYVGSNRYYHYEIHISTDGENYTKVAEKADSEPETVKGKTFEFEETLSARYVKVIMTYNSANRAVHMKEFQVIGALDNSSEDCFEIKKQPEDTAADSGSDATVTVEATGKDLTYTWYYKNPGSTKFYVSGSTFAEGNTYHIPMNAWRDGQLVYCVITDAEGNTLTSDTVTLSLTKAAVTITKQPESIAVEKSGDTAVVTVEAEGEDLTYTWYYKNPGNAKFYVSGDTFAHGNSYSISVNQWRDGQQVYCVITDATGNTVRTETVTLSIQN